MVDEIKGVLPSQSIKKLIKDLNIISRKKEISTPQIQPASLDLRLGETAYRVRASFLPGKNSKVLNRLKAPLLKVTQKFQLSAKLCSVKI